MVKQHRLLMTYAAMYSEMMNGSLGTKHKEREELTEEEVAEIKQIRHEKANKRKKQKGMKYFTINGEGVWALNENNARRKINKRRSQ